MARRQFEVVAIVDEDGDAYLLGYILGVRDADSVGTLLFRSTACRKVMANGPRPRSCFLVLSEIG